MARRQYFNAPETLPPEVFEAVSSALGGEAGFLWVPARRNINREARNREVLRLFNEGLRISEIAEHLFVSERTIWRILARARAAGDVGAGTAGRAVPGGGDDVQG
jgi:DNA-binding NarL/FixJ family response regulator